MRLIRLFYKPFEALGELRGASWVPAFAACVALSLLSNLIIVNAIGPSVILGRVPTRVMSRAGESATFAGLYAGRTAKMIVGLLLISLVIWLVLRIVHKRSETEGGAAFAITFTVCSHAAYAREAVRFIIWLVAVAWHCVVRVPLTETQQIKTNLAAVLDLEPPGRLFILARAIDVLTFLFLGVVAVGLWKVVPNLRPRRAAAVVLVSWLIYVGLALLWGR